MKNRLSAIALLAMAVVLSAFESKTEFYEAINADDFITADSLLEVWENTLPGDTELFPAKFNYSLAKARQSVINLSSAPPREGDLTLFDSTGVVGSIGVIVSFDDEYFQKAIDIIDKGIAANPKRLDFRFGKSMAMEWNKRWADVVETVGDVINTSLTDGFDWYWTDNEHLQSDSAKIMIQDGCYDYLSELTFDTIEDSVPLVRQFAQKIVKLFPDDYRVVNVLGVLDMYEENYEGARNYFEQALEIKPDDGLVSVQWALATAALGDTDTAMAKYREITDNPDIDEDIRQLAAHYADQLSGEAKEIRKYDYFFKYLPVQGEWIAPGSGDEIYFLDILAINERGLQAYHMTSPFKNDEISAKKIEIDDDTVVYGLTFPEPAPDEITICRYVVYVPAGDRFKIYMLEKSFMENLWIIGSMDNNAHLNYGACETIDNIDDFIQLLDEKNLIKPRPDDPDSDEDQS